MIHYVPLKKLPADLEIPKAVEDRFWYDDDREYLVFDGPMWKSTFDRLRGLSRDFYYQRALEDLFRIAVPEDHTAQQRGRWPALLVVASFAAVVLGGLLWPVWSHLVAGK
jgi:hypothetical protein